VTFGAAGTTLRAGVGGTLANNVALANSGTISNGGLAQTLSGVVGGAGGVTIAGTGTTTLTGVNTYTGVTTIAAGNRLVIGGAGQLVSGSSNSAGSTITNNGVFEYASSADQFIGSNLAGTGSLVKTGTGTLTINTLNNNNSYSGGTILSEGRLRVRGVALGSGTLSFNGGALSADSTVGITLSIPMVVTSATATIGDAIDNGSVVLQGLLDLGGATRTLNVLSAVQMSGAVSNGGFTKLGSGILTLSSSNTFAGGATLTEGRVLAGTDASLGSGTITFNGGGLSSNNTGARTFTNPVVFSGSGTLGDTTQTGALTFSGGVDLGGATRTINVLSSATFSGAVSGAGGLTKDGAGNLVLSTANSYGGPTSVNAGTLTVGDASALGSDAAALNVNGGTLSIGSGLDIVRTGPITVAGGVISGGTLTNGGASPLAGQSGTISSVLAGSAGLTKTSNGLLTLSGANTFTGPLRIESGTLRTTAAVNNAGVAGALGSGSNIIINGGAWQWSHAAGASTDRTLTIGTNGATVYVAGAVTTGGTLAGAIEYEGSGARTLNLLVGESRASATRGAFLLGNIGDNGGPTTINVAVGSGMGAANGDQTNFTLSGTINATGGLNVASGSNLRVILTGNYSGLGGGVTIGEGSTLALATGTLATSAVNNGRIASEQQTAQNVTITGTISGNGSVVQGGGGAKTLRLLSTENSYTGTTTLNSASGITGTLIVSKLANGGVNSSIGASSSAAANLVIGPNAGSHVVQYVGTGDSTDRLFTLATSNTGSSGGLTIRNDGSGGLDFTNTGAIVFDNSASSSQAFGLPLTLSGSYSGTNSFAPVIADNSGATKSSLVVSGSGAWIVSGNNSFSGGSTLSGGVARLILGSASALGTGTLTMNGGLAAGLDLSGVNAVQNAVVLGGNSAGIVGSNNIELAGVVSSAGNRLLTIANTGTTTFSNANTYTGTTSVDAGVLVLNNSSALSTSNLRINNGVIGLTGSSGGDFTRALGTGNSQVQITGGGGFAAIDGNRSVNLGGSGATVTWGAGNFMTASGGTFELGAAGGVGVLDFQNAMALGGAGNSRNIFVEKGASLIDAKLSGIISGGAGFSKLGTGVLELTGQNTYTGTTTVAAGKLLVNGTNSGGGRMIVEAGATLGGSGRIAGVVDVFGTLSPGNSPGLLTTGSLVLNASSTTLIDITGAVRGTEYDGIDLLNNDGLTYGGALSFDITSLFSESVTLDIFNFGNGTSLGDFASVSATGAYGAFNFSLTAPGSGIWEYIYNPGNPTNETTIRFRESTGDIEFAVVPEPGSLAICGIGVAMAAWRLRRRRR
jgi:autotransporter-associated beta strand protein